MRTAQKVRGKSLLSFGEVAWDGLWLLNRLPGSGGDCQLLLDQGGAGGCALNTACVLAGLGLPVELAGNAVGQDERGRLILRYLKKVGVRSRIPAWSGVETPFCQCLVEDGTGERHFILRHRSIQETRPELWGEVAKRARRGAYSHLFVQPYLEELSFRFLEETRQVQGLWILIQDVEAGSPFVPRADAVQLSLGSGEKWSEAACLKRARAYFRGRMRQVFITGGERGVAYCQKDGRVELFPAVPVRRIADTTGCGDAFRAGLMAGLFCGLSIREAVRLGNLCGARKAALYGSHFSDGLAQGLLPLKRAAKGPAGLGPA